MTRTLILAGAVILASASDVYAVALLRGPVSLGEGRVRGSSCHADWAHGRSGRRVGAPGADGSAFMLLTRALMRLCAAGLG